MCPKYYLDILSEHFKNNFLPDKIIPELFATPDSFFVCIVWKVPRNEILAGKFVIVNGIV